MQVAGTFLPVPDTVSEKVFRVYPALPSILVEDGLYALLFRQQSKDKAPEEDLPEDYKKEDGVKATLFFNVWYV